MIYLIITASIYNKSGIVNNDHRKKRYIECISAAIKLVQDTEIKLIVVENNGPKDTYLNNLGCDIVYTNNNKTLFSKGTKELVDIQEVLRQYNIKDDDTVIKLTGRYRLLSDAFFKLIRARPDIDAFIKFFNVCTLQFDFHDCVLGLFAIKAKYLKSFVYPDKTSPEIEFATFVRSKIKQEKILEISDLQLECCFADDLRLVTV